MKDMKCYIDTNVLVHFKNEDSDLHKITVNKLKNLLSEGNTLYISSLILDEFLYVFSKLLRKVTKEEKLVYDLLKKALESILEMPFELIEMPADKNVHKDSVYFMRRFNMRPRDVYHLKIMQENSVEYLFTYDRDFQKIAKTGLIKLI